MKKPFAISPIFVLGCLAMLLYCSWPLGYLLNPVVSRHSLASLLEAPGQPFHQVFIALDLLTGILVLAVGLLQLRKLKGQRLMKVSIVSYIAFGLLVAAAALLPERCDPTVSACGPILHNPILLMHGVCSILSVVMLFISATIPSRLIYRLKTPRWLRLTYTATLVGWLVFIILAPIEEALRIHNNLLQDYFITICSLTLLVSVLVWKCVADNQE